MNRKKSVKRSESTYPFRSLALARPPPVKFSGSKTRKEKTDILTMQRRANRWKRRKISASNPTRLMIYLYCRLFVCLFVCLFVFHVYDCVILGIIKKWSWPSVDTLPSSIIQRNQIEVST